MCVKRERERIIRKYYRTFASVLKVRVMKPIKNQMFVDQTGNTGCGVWIMSASKPYIHGNQISENGDAGIMMVNKTVSATLAVYFVVCVLKSLRVRIKSECQHLFSVLVRG